MRFRALVNFVLMDGTDTGYTFFSANPGYVPGSSPAIYPVSDPSARASQIDIESANIVNNFWTAAQYRNGMTQAQLNAVKNF